MSRFLPPLCLFFALALLVAGFALRAVDAPQPGVDLHRAAASGDDQYRQALEEQLRRRQWQRSLLLASLFIGSGVFAVAAFVSMKPAETRIKLPE